MILVIAPVLVWGILPVVGGEVGPDLIAVLTVLSFLLIVGGLVAGVLGRQHAAHIGDQGGRGLSVVAIVLVIVEGVLLLPLMLLGLLCCSCGNCRCNVDDGGPEANPEQSGPGDGGADDDCCASCCDSCCTSCEEDVCTPICDEMCVGCCDACCASALVLPIGRTAHAGAMTAPVRLGLLGRLASMDLDRLLAHHPPLPRYDQDVYRVAGTRVCIGCATTYPVFLLAATLWTWMPPPPYPLALALGATLAMQQAWSSLGRARRRWSKAAVKACLGLGLALWLHGVLLAPWSPGVQTATLLTTLGLAFASTIPRRRRMHREMHGKHGM